MPLKPTPLLMLVAAALTLAACEKKTTDAQADAVRDTSDAAAADLENRANTVEEKGEANADAMREGADEVRDRGERKADAIEEGTVGATTKTDQMTTTTDPKPN